MIEPLIAATVIGSWSFPGWYEQFIADVAAHPDRFGPVDREEAVRDAVRLAIDDQLRAGLDRITDGEMQRVDFNLGFYDYLGGLEPSRRSGDWGAPAHDQRTSYRCVGPLTAPDGLGTVDGVPPAPRVRPGARQDARPRARSRWPAASTAARSTPTATP